MVEGDDGAEMHKSIIAKYRERITPVDPEMSSDLFSVSFYHEEYQR